MVLEQGDRDVDELLRRLARPEHDLGVSAAQRAVRVERGVAELALRQRRKLRHGLGDVDAALADAWKKDAPTDAAGHPAFDMLAIQTSRITAYGSTDVYRIGKSLRRKGFDPAALDDLRAVEERANATLAGWAGTPGAIGIHREDRTLAGRRTWRCELPEGAVELPCGGTHLTSLAEVEAITVALASVEVPGGVEMTMTTGIRLAR